jgi:hypothetical protein
MEANYGLICPPESFDELATAWMNAPDREAIAQASYRIERALMENPLTVGFARNSSVN